MRSGIRIHVHDAESHLAERELSEPFLLMCCHQTVGMFSCLDLDWDGAPKRLAHGLVVVGAGGLSSLVEFVLTWHLVSSRCLQSKRSKRMVFFRPDLGSHPASLLFRHKELTNVSLVLTGGTRIKEF